MHLFIFFDLRQTPMASLAIFFLNHSKYAQNNKSIKYHFTQLTLTQIHLDTNTRNQRLFWKTTFEDDPLCLLVSCQCNSAVQEAVNPLVGSIGKALETITSSVFLKPHNGISGLLQPFIITDKEFKLFLRTYIRKSLILAPKLRAPKIDELCPNCYRIVHENPMFLFYNNNKYAKNNKSN